ncbi:MAG: metallophosphoesterase [Clostridia bacterium]|nr:metallophosphoesterase [Clostridia bacterium]
MSIIKTKLNVGATKPFKVLHMTDTHLTYADMRDGERKVNLALSREKIFPENVKTLEYGVKTAKELNVPIFHTGDLIDFVSLANLEETKKFTDEVDVFISAGNHEFSQYVGEAVEDADYRNQSLDKVQKVFKNDIRASSRVINGVNFLAIDNGYYLFEKEQLAFLKSEVKKGLPIVLLFHNPLFEKNLFDLRMKEGNNAALVGVPKELMANYPEKRFIQQLADDVTLETIEFIKNESKIKAIITGHLHFNYESELYGRIPQIITSCIDIRLIEFI